jgi:thiol-disulfide isomerase/thioredoxin
LSKIRYAISQRLPGHGFWQSRAAWVGIAALGVFLFAACMQTNARSDDAVPDFELALFETENHTRGEILRLSQFQGRPVVVNFWFPSCPPCVAEMPDLEAAFQAHKDDGVEFIGVQFLGIDSIEDGQEFIDVTLPERTDGITVTYALGPDEGDTVIDYKVISFPTTFFLDKDQNVVRKWAGPLNAEKLDELIQDILD